jgi:hypothetical protein
VLQKSVRDFDVRTALRRKVFARYAGDPGTRIIHELGLACGAARADIAVVNGRLHGYEIKSDSDTLERLPSQITVYGAVFDRVTLVVGERHLAKSLATIPDWWGVKVAVAGPRCAVHFREERLPLNNDGVVAIAVAQLLWRGEVLSLLEASGSAAGVRGKSRMVVWQRLVESMSLDNLRREVRAQLKAREGWRSDEPQTPCGDSSPRVATS